VNWLIEHEVSPDTLSILNGIFYIIAAALLIATPYWQPLYDWRWWVWVGVANLIFWGGVLDLLDGEVARETGTASGAGDFVDGTMDHIGDWIVMGALLLGGLVPMWLGVMLFFFSANVAYTRARAQSQGVNMRDVGFLNRAERTIGMTAFFVLAAILDFIFGYEVGIGIFVLTWIGWFMILYLICLIQTFFQRFLFAYRSLKEMDKEKEESAK
jgi:archaetidylinositol phosphate synthase